MSGSQRGPSPRVRVAAKPPTKPRNHRERMRALAGDSYALLHRGSVRQFDQARSVTARCALTSCRWCATVTGADASGPVIAHLMRAASLHTRDTGHGTTVAYTREIRFRHRATDATDTTEDAA